MWKPAHRVVADRSGLRYPSDLTDAEWAIVGAMIPPARHGGPRRSVDGREVRNGIFYLLWPGCQWTALPTVRWLDPSGYDAGKEIKGRKRHILVDTLGLLLNVVVHPADVQDRDGAFLLLRQARRLLPFIKRIFADRLRSWSIRRDLARLFDF
jgi:transposase